MLPSKNQVTICFAHVAYRLRERFLTLATGIENFEVRDGATLEQRIGDADVLVVSGFWRNDLLPRAKRLRFIRIVTFEACSGFTHVTATGSLSRPRRPLSRGFSPTSYPHKPLVSFRINRQLSGWNHLH
jgi:hypothetical protein